MGGLRPRMGSVCEIFGCVIGSAPLNALTSLSARHYPWLDGAVCWVRKCWNVHPCSCNSAHSEALCVAVIAVSCADTSVCLHRRSGTSAAVWDRPEICGYWCDALGILRRTSHDAVTSDFMCISNMLSADFFVWQFASAMFACELG